MAENADVIQYVCWRTWRVCCNPECCSCWCVARISNCVVGCLPFKMIGRFVSKSNWEFSKRPCARRNPFEHMYGFKNLMRLMDGNDFSFLIAQISCGKLSVWENCRSFVFALMNSADVRYGVRDGGNEGRRRWEISMSCGKYERRDRRMRWCVQDETRKKPW